MKLRHYLMYSSGSYNQSGRLGPLVKLEKCNHLDVARGKMKWRTHEGQRSQQNLQQLSGLLNAEWKNLSLRLRLSTDRIEPNRPIIELSWSYEVVKLMF